MEVNEGEVLRVCNLSKFSWRNTSDITNSLPNWYPAIQTLFQRTKFFIVLSVVLNPLIESCKSEGGMIENEDK